MHLKPLETLHSEGVSYYLRKKETLMGRYDEAACCCALNRVFGFEPRIAVALIDAMGSASEVFEMSPRELDDMFGPFSKYNGKISLDTVAEAEDELVGLDKAGCRFIGITDDDFPQMLRDCDDPPAGIYYKGEDPPAKVFSFEDSISVVGTRNVTSYGVHWCERIVEALSRSKPSPSIISGLALGTDVTAHHSALENNLPTIAVMATGIDAVYPYRHINVAERIVHTPGSALITDYPPHTTPMPLNFLRRNRLIAALGRATILIESRIKGGGMMTCSLAASYGREVYALPGRADDPMSAGCNKLIREKSAEAISDEESLCASLGLSLASRRRKTDLSSEMRTLYEGKIGPKEFQKAVALVNGIRRCRDITVEELSSRLSLTYAEASQIIAMLECDGVIRKDMLGRCSINMK